MILAALALAGCAVREPAVPLPPFDSTEFLTFLTPRPLLPFRATGSLVLTYGGERESGEMVVAGGRDGAYLVELHAPLTGALILRLHFDEARMMVLNFGRKTWFRGDNTPETRRRVLSVDISPEEFQVLVTGRFPRPRFARLAGTITAEGTAVVPVGPVVYRFRLDPAGLPVTWVKERDGVIVFRAEFRSYLEVNSGSGPPLRVPQKVRVFTGGKTPWLILGVREFSPRPGGLAPAIPEGPPDPEWRFELPPADGSAG